MPPLVIAGIALTAAGLAATLLSEHIARRWVLFVAKPVASLGFILAAIGSGAFETAYGVWVFWGLVLSFIGDLFLMFEDASRFLAGLAAFLFGHVSYVVAFLVLGVSGSTAFAAGAGVLVVAGFVARWLLPHVQGQMLMPVLSYMVVISVMVVLALGTLGAGHTVLIATGAVLFFMSDLFVARQRFVTPGFVNRLVGLPLYYLGQFLLALSVAA